MKKKLQKTVLVLMVSLAFVALFFIDRLSDKQPVVVSQQSKTLKFVFEIKNESNKVIKDSKFATYLPIESDQQTVADLKASQEHTIRDSLDGNRVLESTFGLIPPFGIKNISISANVLTTSIKGGVEQEPDRAYLEAEEYIEVDNAKIVALAKQLEGESQQETVTNIYQWVTKNLRDSGYTSQDKGAVFALESRRGDCTEFMYLTIALARALGIHARGVGGYVYKESVLVNSADYHNWAELYFDGRWHVVDGQKKRFLDTSGDYVSMRYLSDKKLSLLGSSHRFSVINKDLTVKMR